MSFSFKDASPVNLRRPPVVMTTTRSTFSRQLESFSSFDDGSGRLDEDSSSSKDVPSKGQASQAVAVPSMRPQDLVMAALLEVICFIHVRDPLKSKQLFREISRELVAQGLMVPLGPQQELCSLRAQYKQGFSMMLRTAMDTIAQQNIPVTPPSILQQRAAMLLQPMGQPHRLLGTPGFCNSRYRDEFHEVKVIDKGGFGKVFQARHNLDKKCYAVKKIPLKRKTDIEKWNKVFREAQNLATLTHPNVVRYHSAWLEQQYSPVNSPESESESTTPNSNMGPHVTDLNSDMAEQMEEDSVVFLQSSSTEDSLSNANTTNDDSSHLVQPRRVLQQHSSPGSLSTTDENDLCESSALVLARTNMVTVEQFSAPVVEPLHVCLFIQMELCQETLASWMRLRNDERIGDPDPFSLVNEKRNQMILKQMLNGLDYIHKKNLMHRDIKPKNIFLNWTDRDRLVVKLGDFGLARHVYSNDTPMTPHPGVRSSNFYTGSVGTLLYAAPEQLNGSNYDFKCDMFSLGVVLFELYHPFFTESERTKTLLDLNKGCVPEVFQQHWPKQCHYVRRLISLNASERPNTSDLINSEIFLSKDKIIQQLRDELVTKDDLISQLKARIQELELRPTVSHQHTTTDVQLEASSECSGTNSRVTFSSHQETIHSSAFKAGISSFIRHLQPPYLIPKSTDSHQANGGASNVPRMIPTLTECFPPHLHPRPQAMASTCTISHLDDNGNRHMKNRATLQTDHAGYEDTKSKSGESHRL